MKISKFKTIKYETPVNLAEIYYNSNKLGKRIIIEIGPSKTRIRCVFGDGRTVNFREFEEVVYPHQLAEEEALKLGIEMFDKHFK